MWINRYEDVSGLFTRETFHVSWFERHERESSFKRKFNVKIIWTLSLELIELVWRFIGFTTFHSEKFLCLILSGREKRHQAFIIVRHQQLTSRHVSKSDTIAVFHWIFNFLWQKRFFISLLSVISPTLRENKGVIFHQRFIYGCISARDSLLTKFYGSTSGKSGKIHWTTLSRMSGGA